MERVKVTTVSDAKTYFAEELRVAMQKHQVTATNLSVEYLATLLTRFITAENLFPKNAEGKPSNQMLSELYAEYLNSNTEQKKQVLQRLGDISLMVSGFFSDSLQRKLVDSDYYFGMGESAYLQLSDLQLSLHSKNMYEELGSKFKPFSNVLGEMSEKTHVQSNADLLKTYERWLQTGSDRLKTTLNEKGIKNPLVIDLKIKH